jgi:hypothetical protein
MKKIAAIILILFVGTASAQIRPDRKSWVNGITYEGESITCDLPNDEQMPNIGSFRDGAGMCVFTSIEMAARYHGLDQMRGYRDWVAKNYAGGGWPEKVDKTMSAWFTAKGIDPVPYAQFEGPDPQPMLGLIEKTGRMSSITYGYSPRYGRGSIAHMVNGIHFGPKFGVVLDNNFVGDNKYEWMGTAELIRRARLNGSRQGSAWIFAWLAPSPPPPPKLKRPTGVNHACVCWPFCECGSCRCP